MQRPKLVDNATAGLKFQDSSTSAALDGTIVRSIFQNDNFDNLFNLVINAGYDLIDDDLSQVVKAVKGEYNATFTYNTSTIATQSVNDIVLGTDGIFYEVQSDAVSGDNPVGSVTGDWKPYLPYKSGMKNLIINSRKSIQQRSLTGGKIQVIEADMNIGGNHALSFTGTATATVYEFPALLADYATTIADGSTNTLASAVASGKTVAPTAGYYIAIEFSTTDFDNIQFEQGNVATDLEIRHKELELCQKFYFDETGEVSHSLCRLLSAVTRSSDTVTLATIMRDTPTVATSNISHIAGDGSPTSLLVASAKPSGFRLNQGGSGFSSEVSYVSYNYTADAEIFGTTEAYKEDRWFI